jgi:hypothetical protein
MCRGRWRFVGRSLGKRVGRLGRRTTGCVVLLLVVRLCSIASGEGKGELVVILDGWVEGY